MLKPLAVEFICNIFPQLVVFAMGLGYCYFVGLDEAASGNLSDLNDELKWSPNTKVLNLIFV